MATARDSTVQNHWGKGIITKFVYSNNILWLPRWLLTRVPDVDQTATSGRHEDESAETPVLKAKGSRFLSEFSMQIYFASDTGVEAMWKNGSIATSKKMERKRIRILKNYESFLCWYFAGSPHQKPAILSGGRKEKGSSNDSQRGEIREVAWQICLAYIQSAQWIKRIPASKHGCQTPCFAVDFYPIMVVWYPHLWSLKNTTVPVIQASVKSQNEPAVGILCSGPAPVIAVI